MAYDEAECPVGGARDRRMGISENSTDTRFAWSQYTIRYWEGARLNPGQSEVGLCFRCRHARVVPTPERSYWMCELSLTDRRFDKYPRLPVLACDGFVAKGPGGETPSPDGV